MARFRLEQADSEIIGSILPDGRISPPVSFLIQVHHRRRGLRA